MAGLVGSVVDGKYRLARHVATGGQGAVYDAESLTGGRSVAVKVLRTDRAVLGVG